MIKKLIILLCVLAFVLGSCGKQEETVDEEAVSSLSEAINATNVETKFSGKYMLEITFGDSAVLYYALGNAAWDSEKGVASATFDQTYLGVSSVAANYFENGKMTSVDNGTVLELERDKDTLFSKFPYAKLPEYKSEYGNIVISESSQGKTYKIKRSDTKDLCDIVVGGDIYTIANVIKKPQPEKTQYGETECVYTVKDGKVVGCRYEFDVKLFDTPAYVPGGAYNVSESEYTLDIHVTAKVTYEKFGDDVEVLTYIAESETTSK
ncbi:MAG: hypothetical protein IJC20_02280 [Clostridia bacterium]|nr:hypothetical protein [Clostridia bacterium]